MEDNPTNQPDTTVLENTQTPRNFKNLIISIVIILILIGVTGLGYYFFLQQNNLKLTDVSKKINLSYQQTTETAPLPLQKIPDEVIKGLSLKPTDIIAKVGAENIYLTDLQAEMAYNYSGKTPPPTSLDSMLNKIIEDSILLQSAEKIVLTADIFNSPEKDYAKRTKMANELKQIKLAEIIKSQTAKTGKVISIWYLNEKVGPLGLDKSKELAMQKLTDLKNQVEAKKITIDQAIAQIKSDTGLSQLDYNYKGNAEIDFILTSPDETLVANKDLTKELWTLSKGGVSKIYEVKPSDREGFYAFGVVTDSPNTFGFKSYTDWLNSKKKELKVEKF